MIKEKKNIQIASTWEFLSFFQLEWFNKYPDQWLCTVGGLVLSLRRCRLVNETNKLITDEWVSVESRTKFSFRDIAEYESRSRKMRKRETKLKPQTLQTIIFKTLNIQHLTWKISSKYFKCFSTAFINAKKKYLGDDDFRFLLGRGYMRVMINFLWMSTEVSTCFFLSSFQLTKTFYIAQKFHDVEERDVTWKKSPTARFHSSDHEMKVFHNFSSLSWFWSSSCNSGEKQFVDSLLPF